MIAKTISSVTNYFFKKIDEQILEKNTQISSFLINLEEFANQNKRHIFAIQTPLVDADEFDYQYGEYIILLSPKYKIAFINFNQDLQDDFEETRDEILEDLGSIARKYKHTNYIGRPKSWKELTYSMLYDNQNIKDIFAQIEIPDFDKKRIGELLISLLIGSVNDINRVRDLNQKDNIIDVIKKNIILFDTTQTNFLYQKQNKKLINIQGLSGTGKTELLLHKLKELYIESDSNKIFFTCHNKVLADSLRKRIPNFFDQMSVEKQIEWNERLWCTHAWGSYSNKHSGAYSYICNFYGINFYNYRQVDSFSKACELAIDEIKGLDLTDEKGFAFDYMLVDESQDFSKFFIELCELVTKKQVYVAGDIFQSIFGKQPNLEKVDYLLNQCYRTDPRTLMFSHGMSMGLFESQKLQWLTDKQWENYGYNIVKNDNGVILSRNPIRRFEENEALNAASIELVNTNELNSFADIAREVSNQIIVIQRDYPNVEAGDIAIILMQNDLGRNTEISSLITNYLEESNIDWEVNRAFETKVSSNKQLVITNQNNVKGLEFSFIICVAFGGLTNSLISRNRIYMALTRSFIKSILLMPMDHSLEQSLLEGLKNINENGKINTAEPDQDEKKIIEKINVDFDTRKENRSFRSQVFEIIDEIDPKCSVKIKDLILKTLSEFNIDFNNDISEIREKVELLIRVVSK